MSLTKLIPALSVFLAAFSPVSYAAKPPRADFSRLVVVGDSLSAGFQNFSLLDTQQIHGYASLVAQQAGTNLVLPLVPYPGAPNVLSLVSLGPPPVIAPVPGSLPVIPRDNFAVQPTDLAVPGVTLGQVLTQVPNALDTTPVGQLGNIVLGFPTPFFTPGVARTQVEQAVDLKPTTIIAWAGNNDALLPALTNNIASLTPVADFQTSYKILLDRLVATKATIITANIPDVTDVSFFVPISQVAAQVGTSVDVAAQILGVESGDFLRITGLSQAEQILTGQIPGPLQLCPSPTPGVGPNQISCALKAADAQRVSAQVAAYNTVIANEAAAHGAVLVDIYSLMNQLHKNGITIGGQRLTTDFLGGLFSLDGFHPTNTGYAVIANAFIDTINHQLHTQIPDVSLPPVMLLDPFFYLRLTESSK